MAKMAMQKLCLSVSYSVNLAVKLPHLQYPRQILWSKNMATVTFLYYNVLSF